MSLPAHRRFREAERAITQMDGVMLGSKKVQCSWAKDSQGTSSTSYAAVHKVA